LRARNFSARPGRSRRRCDVLTLCQWDPLVVLVSAEERVTGSPVMGAYLGEMRGAIAGMRE